MISDHDIDYDSNREKRPAGTAEPFRIALPKALVSRRE